MLSQLAGICRNGAMGAALALAAGLVALPAAAQGIDQVDPNSAIDGDLASGSGYSESAAGTSWGVDQTAADPYAAGEADQSDLAQPTFDQTAPVDQGEVAAAAATQAQQSQPSTTYGEDDLIGAAEGLFGKGAEGLARVIQDILKEQGEPNGYIVGREGGGALVLGVRYGSGTLFHKIEGNMPVYWTGPSIGFDAGANAGNTFVLVYNLFDTEQLYERYPAGEGAAYLVGGFNASYMRKDNVVLIPIRVGAGLRLGVNAGYMKFSKKQRWLPF